MKTCIYQFLTVHVFSVKKSETNGIFTSAVLVFISNIVIFFAIKRQPVALVKMTINYGRIRLETMNNMLIALIFSIITMFEWFLTLAEAC